MASDRTLELPLVPVLIDMSARACASIRRRSAQSQVVEQELTRLMKQVFEMAGSEFNIGSPKQLAEILFDKLGLRC